MFGRKKSPATGSVSGAVLSAMDHTVALATPTAMRRVRLCPLMISSLMDFWFYRRFAKKL